MTIVIAGSWRAGFTFTASESMEGFSRKYQPWLAVDPGEDVRCSLDSSWSDLDLGKVLSTRFTCSLEGSTLVFNKGVLRVKVHQAEEPWRGEANPDQLVSFLGEMTSRIEMNEQDRFFYTMNLILRALSLAWTAFHRGFLLHASAVAGPDGRCFLFSGLSGSGKSTAARSCAGYEPVSEDVVEIRMDEEGRVICHSTPLNNLDKQGGRPFHGPLSGIFLIEQGERMKISTLEPTQAMGLLVKNAMMDCLIPSRESDFLDVLSGVAEKVPCFVLGFPLGCSLDKVIKDPYALGPLRSR